MSGANEASLGLAWILSTLQGDSQMGELAPGGFHRGKAPVGTATPYVIFNHQSGTDITTINAVRLYSDYLYQIKAVGEASKTAAVFSAAKRIDALFGGPLATPTLVTGGIIHSCNRQSPVQYDEMRPDGVQIVHSGGLHRIEIQAT